MKTTLFKRCFAEFIGTFGVVFAGTGAIMIDHLSGGQITHLGIGLTFGLIVGVMVYATGHISGGHINPAVTLGLTIARHFPLQQLPAYWIAQLLGGSVASLSLRYIFGEVAMLGATIPNSSVAESLGVEIVATFFLMFVIMAVATDVRAVGQTAALAIGGTVALDAIIAGQISGASMNPARSFGPAIVSWVWSDHWIYWVAPFIGMTLGALLYSWLRGEDNAVA